MRELSALKLPFFIHVSKVSDQFFDALAHDGSVCRECQCGRTHFASWDKACFEPGELEELLVKAEQEPDKYIEHTDTSVAVAHLSGKEFVYECPCEGLVPYEKFVWSHREEILAYLTARHKQQLKVLKTFNEKLQQYATALAEVEKVHVPT